MNIQIVICPFCGCLTQAVSAVYYVFHQVADFHADFCYFFQIAERTWTPLSTEGDKNKSRKRLHLRCRIGTFLFCFLCIDTSTAAASSSHARGLAVLTALPSCSLQKFYSKVFAGVATLLLSQPCLHFGRQPQHSSYEP